MARVIDIPVFFGFNSVLRTGSGGIRFFSEFSGNNFFMNKWSEGMRRNSIFVIYISGYPVSVAVRKWKVGEKLRFLP